MRFDGNQGGAINYEPNSFGGPVEDKRFKEPPLKISGDADRYDHRAGNDDFTQPGNLFRLMSPTQQAQLLDNIAAAMKGVPEEIARRQIGHFLKADRAYGVGVAKRLGLKLEGAAAAE
jgi:catalase